MEHVIAWCGFLGAWLLVAGPIYQAAIELEEESFQREDFHAALDRVERPDPVSPWWWLLPPVMWIKQRRIALEHRERMLSVLTPEQGEALVSYSAKSTGWFMVGAGGFLIATKETWELVELDEWPHLVFWLLVVLMLVLCFANVALQTRRAQGLLAATRAPGRMEP